MYADCDERCGTSCDFIYERIAGGPETLEESKGVILQKEGRYYTRLDLDVQIVLTVIDNREKSRIPDKDIWKSQEGKREVATIGCSSTR